MSGPGIFYSLFYGPLKHLYNLIFNSEYRTFNWLVTRHGGTPRFHAKRIQVDGWDLVVPDVASFLSAFKEIFVEEIYSFPSVTDSPIILDCGANIGLSVLYFKSRFPNSRIVAYEADPHICRILEDNLSRNGVTGVEIINKAVWTSDTFVDFIFDGADGGRIIDGEKRNKSIKIPSVGLLTLLQAQTYDFVKIDIEGAEYEVLKKCGPFLANLKYVFVEFHSFIDKDQHLGELISLFENNQFRVHLHPPFTVKSPFLGIQGNENRMDMQLNLFFWREKN